VYTREIYGYLLDKIFSNAITLVAYDFKILGYVAFYCNDISNKKAFISLIAVEPFYQNRRIGSILLQNCELTCRTKGMVSIGLEVKRDNRNAVRFYKHHGFSIIKSTDKIYFMEKELKESCFER